MHKCQSTADIILLRKMYTIVLVSSQFMFSCEEFKWNVKKIVLSLILLLLSFPKAYHLPLKFFFFKCYLWITALTYSAFTQGLGIRIQFSSLPYLISWFFSSSSLEYAYFAIKLNISVWTSPTSLAPTLASIWQDICGLLFCVFLAIMCCII